MNTEAICQVIDQHAEELTLLARRIWEKPEMGWHEDSAVAWTAEVLRDNGFDVEVGAYGMPTAIRAAWGQGRPVVGLCGEYDCLPGLSQKCVPTEDPVVPGGDGHGCGHNLLGAGCVAAAIGIKAALQDEGLSGTVIYYGCPAEEQLSAKGLMAKAGAFKECDFTLAWHPDNKNRDTYGSHTGIEGAYFTFRGTTAHAGGAPHLGRSALDALQLMNLGVEFMREHVTDDVRIHYQITCGGQAPNVVPDYAQANYIVRAVDRENVTDTFRRVVRCAEGAAYMTETTVEITSTGGLYPTLQNTVIAAAGQEARAEVPVNEYTEDELRFADQINRACPEYREGVTLPMDVENQQIRTEHIFGSTDYGDVEHVRPGFQFREATAATLTRAHSWMMTACAGSSIGMKGMLRAGKLMAVTAMKLIRDPERLAAAVAEFEQTTAGAPYVCPVGDDVPWPYDE